MACVALTNIAKINMSLRKQVWHQLVTLLKSENTRLRRRAGALLRDEREGLGDGSKQMQKEMVTSGGVALIVDLLRAGTHPEAREYTLCCLSMISDGHSRAQMVRAHRSDRGGPHSATTALFDALPLHPPRALFPPRRVCGIDNCVPLPNMALPKGLA